MRQELWFWPSSEDVNDFPDPVGIDAEWQPWRADLANGPSKEAEIFAREFIQNSWDSIQSVSLTRTRQRGLGNGALRFSFVELSGAAARKFRASFGVDELRSRYRRMSERNRKDSRLGGSDTVTGAADSKIRLLICSESSGGGMWGHWRKNGQSRLAGSRLRFALIQTKSDKGEDGAGGSWGHGKKAIANASRLRVLGVYTCHEEKDPNHDKAGVTRRFLGVAYWRGHEIDEYEHVGLGLLGALGQTGQTPWQQFEPLENEVADSFVRSLGVDEIEIRDPARRDQRGTTYLILEPSFTPEDLLAAIERNWWPLTIQHKLPISVFNYDGTEILPQPEQRSELLPFIDAYRAATGSGGRDMTTEAIRVGNRDVGNLALFADVSEAGFSYRSDVDDNTSLVALVRNDLVVSYLPVPKRGSSKPPFIRGSFGVDRRRNAEASELLKMAEPHLHNEWRIHPDGSTPRDSADFARKVLDQIVKNVKALQRQYMKPQELKDRHFEDFQELLSGKDKISRSPKRDVDRPPPKPREFRIHEVSKSLVDYDPSNPTRIRLSARAKISLSEAALLRGLSRVAVGIQLAWGVLEEGTSATRDPSLSSDVEIQWPAGFEVDPNERTKATGVMTAYPLTFSWRSGFFPDDWQVVPYPHVELLGQSHSDASSGEAAS